MAGCVGVYWVKIFEAELSFYISAVSESISDTPCQSVITVVCCATVINVILLCYKKAGSGDIVHKVSVAYDARSSRTGRHVCFSTSKSVLPRQPSIKSPAMATACSTAA